MFPIIINGAEHHFWGFETEQTWQAPAPVVTDPWLYNNVAFGPITLTNINVISYWKSKFETEMLQKEAQRLFPADNGRTWYNNHIDAANKAIEYWTNTETHV